MSTQKRRLVVVPTDPIVAYEGAGYTYLESYYNPQGFFDEVYAISPLERGERFAHGMTILGVPWLDFRRRVRAIRPDVVRAYGGYWPAELACASRVSGIPVVVSLHDNLRKSISPVVRYSDMVLCVSRIVRDLANRRGIPEGRLRLFANRVDRNVHRPVQDVRLLEPIARRFPPGYHLLHVGRKADQKNLDTVIRALSRLPSSYQAIFVGHGNPWRYQKLAEEIGVADRCFWIESVPNHELPLWFSWCDCMCTPSRHEGFGIVFIEAAACGAAIVTSDIPPMNEYLEHGKSAFLVQRYLDADAVARSVRYVCETPAFRQRIREGAVRASVPFDRRRVDAMEVGFYREVMNAPSRKLDRWEAAVLTWHRHKCASRMMIHQQWGRLCRLRQTLLNRTD